jgi:uncharacterized membrane protein YgcG
MWQPFFTGVGWDPFMDGAWGWYPGYGYAFASAYPWGWTPYMYGNWAYAPGYGWGWQPGGFTKWHPVPSYTPTTMARVSLAVPTAASGKTVFVGKGGAMPSSASQLTIRGGTAGLGIARGSLSDMKSLNHQVAKSGFAQVHAGPQFAASSGGFASSGGAAQSSSMGHASSSGASGGHSSGGGGGGHH